jgi:hypothetical protein
MWIVPSGSTVLSGLGLRRTNDTYKADQLLIGEPSVDDERSFDRAIVQRPRP